MNTDSKKTKLKNYSEMIKKYNDWLNEGVDPDAAIEKTTPQFEAWAKSLNLEYETDIPGYVKGASYYVTIPIMGLWILKLEEGKRSTGRQDSMYRPQYESSGNYKWYMKYPSRYSQYSPRQGYLPGNLKSFKAVVEKYVEVGKVFGKAHELYDLLNVNAEQMKKVSVTYAGKNQKELYADLSLLDGNFYSPNDKTPFYKARFRTLETRSIDFDPLKGEVYYYAFLGAKPKLELKNADLIEEILELLKDKPVEKVWEVIKSGDWEKIGNDLRGSRTGKKFGL